ncbi:MAG: chorismate dehydratase [Candidatus Omnitrophota bacterium]|jgi:chorismate dehydratase
MRLRVGCIDYVNSLPVDLGLLTRGKSLNFDLKPGFPEELNRGLATGELDISPISTFHYAQNFEDLILVPNMSISSVNAVQSVLLFSKRKIDDLNFKKIYISAQGKTTPELARLVIGKRFESNPIFESTVIHIDDVIANQLDADAFVLLGDDALIAADKLSSDWLVYDLAKEWQDWTGFAFVFAVWAIRKQVANGYGDLCDEVLAEWQKSREWGQTHKEDVLNRAQEISSLSRVSLESYFGDLRYDLKDDLIQGLTHFYKLCFEDKRIESEVPINFYETVKARS